MSASDFTLPIAGALPVGTPYGFSQTTAGGPIDGAAGQVAASVAAGVPPTLFARKVHAKTVPDEISAA